jgi:hypothetical protein
MFASSQGTPLKVTAGSKDNGGQTPEGILLEEFERELKNDQCTNVDEDLDTRFRQRGAEEKQEEMVSSSNKYLVTLVVLQPEFGSALLDNIHVVRQLIETNHFLLVLERGCL